MKKKAILLYFLAFLVTPGILSLRADVVYMKDGTKKEGKVLEKTDKEVVLEVEYGGRKGILRIELEDVQDIESKITPQEEFLTALASLPMDDASGFYNLGIWCKNKGMSSEARLCFIKALEIDPGLDDAGKALGWLKTGGRWRSMEECIAEAMTLVKRRKHEAAAELLKEAAGEDNKDSLNSLERRELHDKLATCYEALGRWKEALAAHGEVIKTQPNKASLFKMRARQRIIEEHPDGMFDCPHDPTLFRQADHQKKRNLLGKQSLTRPEVMEFALRVAANKILGEAKVKVNQAADEMNFRPEKAEKLLEEALLECEKAEYLVADVGRPLRLEIASAIGKMVDVLTVQLLKDIQSDPGFKWTRDGYPGTLDQAQEFLAKNNKLCGLYEKKVEVLRPFPKEAAKELNRAVADMDKGRDMEQKAQKMVDAMLDFKEIDRLEAEATEYAAKAKAIDPNRGTYTTNSYKSTDGLYHFRDDGKEWRRRSDSCIQYCEKSLEANKTRLNLMRKYPLVYSSAREIYYTKRDMTTIYELMLKVILTRNITGMKTATAPSESRGRWR